MELNLPKNAIDLFCKKWMVSELSLFGSVLRDDFQNDSDIDVLVTFGKEAHCSLFDLTHMEDELKTIFGRKVDLVSRRGIEASRNVLRREAILKSTKVIYAA